MYSEKKKIRDPGSLKEGKATPSTEYTQQHPRLAYSRSDEKGGGEGEGRS